MTKNKRQPAPVRKPARLTYDQIQKLALGLANELDQEQGAIRILLVLLYDIIEYPFDKCHAEQIASMMVDQLFMYSTEATPAIHKYIVKEREKLLSAG